MRLHAPSAACGVCSSTGSCASAASLRLSPAAPRRRRPDVAVAGGPGDGDFGARDATAGELESNFSDKVLGNWDTAHIIRGPAGLAKLVGLNTRDCTAERAALRLSSSDCVKLRNQVPGWRLLDDAETKEDNVLLVRAWTARDADAGKELAERAEALAKKEGHAILKTSVASVSGLETVEVTLQTAALKGLTENDFIVAAKLNEMATADLEPPKKKRFWA